MHQIEAYFYRIGEICGLGLVVLDAVVALTTWPKGANANDDEGVKKLIAFLRNIAERHNLTILMLGHLNKKTTREHVADAVTGAAAWTASTRLSFMFTKDPDEEFQGFVRTVKKNTGQHYGASYKTVPVHRVTVRTNGNDEWLCGVQLGETVWGEKSLREEMGDDEHLNRREEKESKVQEIIGRTLEALHANGVTNRKAVEMALGHKPHRRHWKDADKVLASKHGVQVEKIERGEYLYRLTTEPLPCPPAPASTLDDTISRILEKVLSVVDERGQLDSESFMSVVREVHGSHPSDIIIAGLYRAMKQAGVVHRDGCYVRA